MIINLIPDASVASAPAGFVAAMEQAATLLEQAITDDITVNIGYGWGTINGQVDPSLTSTTGAEGGYANGNIVSYATLKAWLSASATSLADLTAIASLPASNSAFPGALNKFIVASAEEKALGQFSGNDAALDGVIGFGTASSSAFWLGAALHEITHAMGRISGYAGKHADLLDVFRYSSAGVYQWTGGQPAYFSIDGGVTVTANYSTVSDYGDFATDSLTPSTDPFDAFLLATALTPIDLIVMDSLGFNVGTPLTVSSGQSQTISAGVRLSSAVVLGGGALLISSGGQTAATTVSGGAEYISVGGQTSKTVVSSGGVQTVDGGTTVSTSLLNGGAETALLGGTASATLISGGGVLNLSSGGYASNSFVFSGGAEAIVSGGFSFGASIGSGGAQSVASGGVASGVTIQGGGAQEVSGGNATLATILSGGQEVVSAGGVAFRYDRQ